ncbi:MAG: hypothetical protein FJ271_12865 [Planctomycetes bacterium]|nr:hypothetical protein [Planctomycetota bacterium]
MLLLLAPFGRIFRGDSPSRRALRRGSIRRRLRQTLSLELLETRVVPTAQGNPVSLLNPGFENGLAGWTQTTSGGNISTVGSYQGDQLYTATQGSRFALMQSGTVNQYVSVSQTFTAQAGQTVSGHAFFDTTDYLPYNDDGRVLLKSGSTVIATLFSKSVSQVGNYGSTSWTSWQFTFATTGTYTLEAGVRNVGDSGVASYLGLDLFGTEALPPAPPTDIVLSGDVISEDSPPGSVVGHLSTTDPDQNDDNFVYQIVPIDGSNDHLAFAIQGNQLVTNAPLDFESQSTHTIRIRSTDQDGQSTEKDFDVSVADVNEAPYDISLDATSVNENSLAGSVVGLLSTVDPDQDNVFLYEIVPIDGSSDHLAFAIEGNQLVTSKPLDFEVQSTFTIRITSTDQDGLSTVKDFDITVTDAADAPTDIGVSAASVGENSPVGTVIGELFAIDQDHGDAHSFSLVQGEGVNDNDFFTIQGNLLLTNAKLNDGHGPYHIVVEAMDSSGQAIQKVLTINALPEVGAPTLTTAAASGPEGSAIALNIQAHPADSDESVFIVIGNMPPGAVLSAGTQLDVATWLLSAEQLRGLSITVPNNVTTRLSVAALSVETSQIPQDLRAWVASVLGGEVPPLLAASVFGGTETVTEVPSFSPLSATTLGELALTVANVAPKVTLGPNAILSIGATYTSTGFFVDPGTETWTGSVNFGDGKGSIPLVLSHDKSFQISRVFDREGDFVITVTINDGSEDGWQSVVVHTVLGKPENIGDSQTQTATHGAPAETREIQGKKGSTAQGTLTLGSGSSTPATLWIAGYGDNPVSSTPGNIQIAGQKNAAAAVAFFDVRITGVQDGAGAQATLNFKFEIDHDDPDPVLLYFDGANWIAIVGHPTSVTRVASSDKPGKDVVTFVVTIDDFSTPKISELGGTVFTVAVPAPATPPPTANVLNSPAVASASPLGVPFPVSTATFNSNSRLNLVLRVSQGTELSSSTNTLTVSGTASAAGNLGDNPAEQGEEANIRLANLRGENDVEFLQRHFSVDWLWPVMNGNGQPAQAQPVVPAGEQLDQQDNRQPEESEQLQESSAHWAIDFVYAQLARQDEPIFNTEDGGEWLVADKHERIDCGFAMAAAIAGAVAMPRAHKRRKRRRKPALKVTGVSL